MPVSVFVTGGTGFLGIFIIEALREKHPDWSITVFDLKPPREPKPHVTYWQGDVTSADDVEGAIKAFKPRVIIHSAGLVPPLKHRFGRELESQVLNINLNGTRNMLTAAKKHGVEAFVWTGSCTAIIDDFRYQYRNIDETYPTSDKSLLYGESKAAAEKLVLAANSATLLTCALRPSVLFGPGDYQLIPSVHACIAKGETPFILGSADNLWDVSYAPNIADAHVLAVENLVGPKSAAGEAIFIQNSEPITFRDFCLEVWKNFGHYPPFQINVPLRAAYVAGWVAEMVTWFTGATCTLTRGSVMDACATRYCSGEKARRLLGYRPKVGIEEGIRISCEVSSNFRGASSIPNTKSLLGVLSEAESSAIQSQKWSQRLVLSKPLGPGIPNL
ncbi:MAG: hypothetical protein Q9217_004498 [Psora testacea]